jgi:hypothetical protein
MGWHRLLASKGHFLLAPAETRLAVESVFIGVNPGLN